MCSGNKSASNSPAFFSINPCETSDMILLSFLPGLVKINFYRFQVTSLLTARWESDTCDRWLRSAWQTATLDFILSTNICLSVRIRSTSYIPSIASSRVNILNMFNATLAGHQLRTEYNNSRGGSRAASRFDINEVGACHGQVRPLSVWNIEK